jgi:N-methylhydantoinase A/oxoprolinase/acetone carboxylase beta subunit
MRASVDLRVGIDVGGTNTDAVVLDAQHRLLAKFKTPTTPDLTSGITSALEAVLGQIDEPVERVTHVMLGTTHATNAILERRDLLRVAVVRIGAPATCSIPPLLDWPDDLRAVISAGEVIVPGGSELTGEPLTPFGREELARFLEKVAGSAEAVAISGVFSPVNADHEFEAQELTREILGDIPISLSHGIGALGLLERENACVLNAALVGVARKVVNGLTGALESNGVSAVAFLTQNDGTLMGLDYVLRFPVLTIGSGPANSMRGAGYLTDVKDALVIDVGGTSSDVGALVNGFPRESTTPVDIGGIRTNFRMPDLVSIAIGGGTRIDRGADGSIRVGPESVGYRLGRESLIFGGTVATLSDAAVWSGRMQAGDGALTAEAGAMLEEALAVSDEAIWNATDQIKTSREPVPLIAVGGGSVILPPTLAGVREILRPDNYDVANAIGAAIASVSGQVDKVFKLAGRAREEVIAEAVNAARDEAISAGADPEAVEIVELDEVPMAYLTEPVIRVRAKAAGPLGFV